MARDTVGLNLFTTWEKNQILVHLHQLSVSDRYFCQAGQEIRLLNYRFSQGLRHFVLPFYRCSIKVSHCNHLSFPWLNTVFHQTPILLWSFQSSPLLSYLFLSLSFSLSPAPPIFWLNLCLLSVHAQNQFRGGQQGSVVRPEPEESGLLVIVQQTCLPYWDICDLDSIFVCTVSKLITNFQI